MADINGSSNSQFDMLKDMSKDCEIPNTANNINCNTTKTLHIINLPDTALPANLDSIFAIYGKIESTNLLKMNAGYISANVTFENSKDALKAQEAANNKEIQYDNKVLIVVPGLSNDEIVNLSQCKAVISGSKKCNYKKHKKFQEISDNAYDNLDLINKLNDDCLIHIFLHLPIVDRVRIERVCKRWQNVSTQAWRDIKVLNLPRELRECDTHVDFQLINNRAIEKILMRCGRFLNYLKLSIEKLDCNTDIVSVIGEHCHNVDKLILKLEKYTCKNLHKLFTRITQMLSFKMKSLERYFTDDHLNSLSVSMTLKKLHTSAESYNEDFYSFCKFFSPFAPAMFRNLKNLRCLSLNRFSLEHDEIAAICDNKNLTSLSFPNCFVKGNLLEISNLPSLQYLNLYRVQKVSNTLLINIATQCTQLEYLNISHCEQVTSDGISALAKLSTLKTLFMNGLSNVDDRVIGNLIYLGILHCEDCYMVRDTGICRLITNAKDLHIINLFDCRVSLEVLNVANNTVKQRANQLPLHIIMNTSRLDEWTSIEDDPSPLLIVKGKNNYNRWRNYWDNSDDDDDDNDDDIDDNHDDDDDINDTDSNYDNDNVD